jgi:2'-5' RNA ligase
MKQAYLDVDVALEVTGSLREVCYALARKVAKTAPLAYMLDGARTPHITLFQGRIPARNLAALCEAARDVADEHTVPQLPMKQQLMVKESGNIFWCAETSIPLLTLHEAMCEAVGGLTLGHMMEYHAKKMRDKKSPRALVAVLSKYGFSCAGPLFDPHITLGRLAHPESEQDVKKVEMKLRALSLKPESIVVGRLGNHGDIVEVLSRIDAL